jgi:hypothetical protein
MNTTQFDIQRPQLTQQKNNLNKLNSLTEIPKNEAKNNQIGMKNALDNLLNDFFPSDNNEPEEEKIENIEVKKCYLSNDNLQESKYISDLNQKAILVNEVIFHLDHAIKNNKTILNLVDTLLNYPYNDEKMMNSMKILKYIYEEEDEELIDSLCCNSIEQENHFKKLDVILKFFSKILKVDCIEIDPSKNINNELYIIQILSYFLQNKLYGGIYRDQFLSFLTQMHVLRNMRSNSNHYLNDVFFKEIYKFLFKGFYLSQINLDDLKLCEGEVNSKTKYFLFFFSQLLKFDQKDLIKDIRLKNMNISFFLQQNEVKDEKVKELIYLFRNVSAREIIHLIVSNHYPNKDYPDLYLKNYFGPILFQLGISNKIHTKFEDYKSGIKEFQERLEKILQIDLSSEYCKFKSLTKKALYRSLKVLVDYFRKIN